MVVVAILGILVEVVVAVAIAIALVTKTGLN